LVLSVVLCLCFGVCVVFCLCIINMDPSGFDNDIFIESVKKHQCIWNTTLGDYHDKIKKRNAWEEVCCDTYPDFKEKPEKEQTAFLSLQPVH